MELREVQAELPDDLDHDRGQEGGAVGIEELVQGPPSPIVVEEGHLPRGEAQEGRDEGAGPLLEGVDRPPIQEDVAQEDEEGAKGRESGLRGAEAAGQEGGNASAVKEMVEDRESPDALDGGAKGLGHREAGEVLTALILLGSWGGAERSR